MAAPLDAAGCICNYHLTAYTADETIYAYVPLVALNQKDNAVPQRWLMPLCCCCSNQFHLITDINQCTTITCICQRDAVNPLGRLKMQDLENVGPDNFTSCWVCINSLNNKLMPNCVCVLIQTTHKWKRSKIVMQKVNPCAQKNEILVHKGHQHEYHSKLCVF